VSWPSWYPLGWAPLFAALAHMMVLAEEDHLLATHGDRYAADSRRVPRYVGRVRRQRSGAEVA